jgi:hypothetical protein
MIELFRRGEVLPEGRTNIEEERLVKQGVPSDDAKQTNGDLSADGQGSLGAFENGRDKRKVT